MLLRSTSQVGAAVPHRPVVNVRSRGTDVRSPLPAPGVADQVKRRKGPRELPIKKAVPSQRLCGARKPTATAGLRSTSEDLVQQLPDSAGPLERQGVVDALPLRLLAHRDNRRGDNRVVQKPPQSEAGGPGPPGPRQAGERPDVSARC